MHRKINTVACFFPCSGWRLCGLRIRGGVEAPRGLPRT